MPAEITLRDRARGAVREEVLSQAWMLFAQRGFEATTVDQIAAAAGMSRRTFFRYFSGKDELVLVRLVEAGERIAAALAARPAPESPWRALRAAFDQVVLPQDQHPEQSRSLQRMLRDEPGLRSSVLERRRRWQELLAPIIASRQAHEAAGQRPPGEALAAEALAACALACLETAQEAWAEGADASLAALLDRAMAAVSSLDSPAVPFRDSRHHRPSRNG